MNRTAEFSTFLNKIVSGMGNVTILLGPDNIIINIWLSPDFPIKVNTDAVLGQSIVDLTPENYRNRLEETLFVVKNEKRALKNFFIHPVDKQWYTFHASHFTEANLDYYIIAIWNSHEEKMNELRLSENEAEIKRLFELAPLRVVKINRKGSILYINRGILQPKEEIERMNVFDFIPEETRAEIKEKYENGFQTMKAFEYEVQSQSEKNEGIADYHVSVSPFYNINNEKEALIIFEDITEEKNSKKALIEKQAQLTAIINNTKDIILSIDKNYNLIEFNTNLTDLVRQFANITLKPGMPVFYTMSQEMKEKVEPIYEKIFNREVDSVTEIFEYYTPRKIKKYYETNYNPIIANNEITGISIISRDVTDRLGNEERLRTALDEKNLLLSEIHHRVKNNLAMISGILQIQRMNSDDTKLNEILKECESRIKTTVLVHEKLYENDNLSKVNFKNYLSDLINDISTSFKELSAAIIITINADSALLDIKTAIPLGLIVNELVTNCFKHAFKTIRKGNISIVFKKINNKITLTVADSGPGFKGDFNLENAESTGMVLLKTFTEQLEADVTITNKPQTSITISFVNGDE